jgi:hypothetical protein
VAILFKDLHQLVSAQQQQQEKVHYLAIFVSLSHM